MQGFVDVAAFYQEYQDFIEFTFGTWGTTSPKARRLQVGEFEHRHQPRHRMGNLVDGAGTWGETTLDC